MDLSENVGRPLGVLLKSLFVGRVEDFTDAGKCLQ